MANELSYSFDPKIDFLLPGHVISEFSRGSIRRVDSRTMRRMRRQRKEVRCPECGEPILSGYRCPSCETPLMSDDR